MITNPKGSHYACTKMHSPTWLLIRKQKHIVALIHCLCQNLTSPSGVFCQNNITSSKYVRFDQELSLSPCNFWHFQNIKSLLKLIFHFVGEIYTGKIKPGNNRRIRFKDIMFNSKYKIYNLVIAEYSERQSI